jgi:hypothetical protein
VEKKNTGKIRVCIDFLNLNKATPKDEYPMPIANMGDALVSLLYLRFYQNIAYGNKIGTLDSKYENKNTAFKTLHMKIRISNNFSIRWTRAHFISNLLLLHDCDPWNLSFNLKQSI